MEQALAFRVMRLSAPQLQTDLPLRLALAADTAADAADVAKQAFAHRTVLRDPIDACGIGANLELPQSFGLIYLGETWCAVRGIHRRRAKSSSQPTKLQATEIVTVVENEASRKGSLSRRIQNRIQDWNAPQHLTVRSGRLSICLAVQPAVHM
jgi:hypothetical protein